MVDLEDPTQPTRLPGLFRAWELGLILRPGAAYRIEEAGETADGASLLAVFHCDHAPLDTAERE